MLFFNLAKDEMLLLAEKVNWHYNRGKLGAEEYTAIQSDAGGIVQNIILLTDVAINSDESAEIAQAEENVANIIFKGYIELPENICWKTIEAKLSLALGNYELAMYKLAMGKDYYNELDKADKLLEEAENEIKRYADLGLIPKDFAEEIEQMIHDGRMIFPPDLSVGIYDISFNRTFVVVGEPVEVTVTVHNTGIVSAENVNIAVYVRPEHGVPERIIYFLTYNAISG